MKFAKYLSSLFLIYILIIPLIFWNGLYEGPKVFWLLTGGFFLTLFWLHRIVFKKKEMVFKRVDYFFLIWLFILIVSSIFGVHPLLSIIGGSYRHQGVLFFLTLWLIYKTVEILPVGKRSFLWKGFGVVVLIESLIVLLQFMTGRVYFGKPLGTIGEANAVAGFLAVGSVFVYSNLAAVYFAIPVISVLITESRAGVLALTPGLIPLIKNFGGLIQKALFALLIVLSVGFLIFVSTEKGSSPFESRQVIWSLGIRQIVKKPFLGFGAESGEVVYNNAFREIKIPLTGLIIDRAHNLILDVAMWSGVIGLIFFTLFIYNKFKAIKSFDRRLALISLHIYSMFQPLSIVHYLFLFLL